jgi:hypothetical protein
MKEQRKTPMQNIEDHIADLKFIRAYHVEQQAHDTVAQIDREIADLLTQLEVEQ